MDSLESSTHIRHGALLLSSSASEVTLSNVINVNHNKTQRNRVHFGRKLH